MQTDRKLQGSFLRSAKSMIEKSLFHGYWQITHKNLKKKTWNGKEKVTAPQKEHYTETYIQYTTCRIKSKFTSALAGIGSRTLSSHTDALGSLLSLTPNFPCNKTMRIWAETLEDTQRTMSSCQFSYSVLLMIDHVQQRYQRYGRFITIGTGKGITPCHHHIQRPSKK